MNTQYGFIPGLAALSCDALYKLMTDNQIILSCDYDRLNKLGDMIMGDADGTTSGLIDIEKTAQIQAGRDEANSLIMQSAGSLASALCTFGTMGVAYYFNKSFKTEMKKEDDKIKNGESVLKTIDEQSKEFTATTNRQKFQTTSLRDTEKTIPEENNLSTKEEAQLEKKQLTEKFKNLDYSEKLDSSKLDRLHALDPEQKRDIQKKVAKDLERFRKDRQIEEQKNTNNQQSAQTFAQALNHFTNSMSQGGSTPFIIEKAKEDARARATDMQSQIVSNNLTSMENTSISQAEQREQAAASALAAICDASHRV